MAERTEQAVVLGAGLAGLLTARVLAETYANVTIIERDLLAEWPLPRRGIPQGRHLHSLLSRGAHAMEELFPGLLEELVAAGAHALDDGDLSRIDIRFGAHGFNRTAKFAEPGAVVQYLASRPFLEFHLRRRVEALPNVTVRDGHDVVECLVGAPDRVTGVRVIDRSTTRATDLDADLVVDAMGRGARTPAFLDHLGYGRPDEQRTVTQGTYYSVPLRLPPGALAEKLILTRTADQSAGTGLVLCEDGSWILTVTHIGSSDDPPTDLAGMCALAESCTPASVVGALRTAQPQGPVAVHRHGGGVWRRYDRMHRFPAGLLVIGDGFCALNPIWGQGMTLAALQALTLRTCLRAGTNALASRFFAAAAEDIGPVWGMNQAREHAGAPGPRPRSVSGRVSTWMAEAAFAAAAVDIVLTERFVRVANLVDPPQRLRDPALVVRIVLSRMRGRRRHLAPV